jgi:hypothetical protein
MIGWQVALVGAAGAIVPDLLKFVNGRFEAAPEWIKRPHYWIAAIILAVLGGAVAYLSGPNRLIDAAALGYAAPTIIANLLGRSDGGPSKVSTTFSPGGTLITDSPLDAKRKVEFEIPQFVRAVLAAWSAR